MSAPHTIADLPKTAQGRVATFLAQISEEVGKSMTLNENGICAFTYEDLCFVIECPAKVESFFMYCDILQLDKVADTEKQYAAKEALLKLDVRLPVARCRVGKGLGKDDETGGASLTLSVSQRPGELECSDFRQTLEDFIDVTLKARKKICKVAGLPTDENSKE